MFILFYSETLLFIILVQSLRHVQLFATLRTAAQQASLSFTILELAQTQCPWSQWCHLTISSSITPFSSCSQSFPASRFFQWVHSESAGQSIGNSESVHPMNFQSWFPLGLTGLISLLSKGLSRVFSKTKIRKRLQHSTFFMVQLSHPYMTTDKTVALTIWMFVGKVLSMIFNMLTRFVIAFLPRSKCLLISWLQSPSTVILEPNKLKSITVSTFSPSICREVMGPDAMILVFWMLSFQPTFSLSSFTFIQSSLVLLHFLP